MSKTKATLREKLPSRKKKKMTGQKENGFWWPVYFSAFDSLKKNVIFEKKLKK